MNIGAGPNTPVSSIVIVFIRLFPMPSLKVASITKCDVIAPLASSTVKKLVDELLRISMIVLVVNVPAAVVYVIGSTVPVNVATWNTTGSAMTGLAVKAAAMIMIAARIEDRKKRWN